MKQLNKLTAIILICAIMLMMAACSSKSYSSVEEWYADNPVSQKAMEAMLKNQNTDGLTIEFEIKENVLIYRYIYDKKIFGQSEEIDKAAKEMLDSSVNQSISGFTQGIDEIAQSTQIDASKISIVLEWYNPGASKPSYSRTIAK